MPEGDTIHRAARRMDAALRGRELLLADAPNPRSPIHGRAKKLEGSVLERVEARGKHLLAHFSTGDVIHSHLGMNGRWWITADGRLPYGKPWLVLSSGRGIASQTGGKLLRLISESRVRNDPGLAQLGPDPLGGAFDVSEAVQRLRRMAAGNEIGDALLDQRIIAGIGNAIRNEALFRAGISPLHLVKDLSDDQLERIVLENERVMQISMAKGRRPRSIYRANRRGCPACGGQVKVQGQGDANRMAYWCPACQA
jgi:endonuclease VIII